MNINRCELLVNPLMQEEANASGSHALKEETPEGGDKAEGGDDTVQVGHQSRKNRESENMSCLSPSKSRS